MLWKREQELVLSVNIKCITKKIVTQVIVPGMGMSVGEANELDTLNFIFFWLLSMRTIKVESDDTCREIFGKCVWMILKNSLPLKIKQTKKQSYSF